MITFDVDGEGHYIYLKFHGDIQVREDVFGRLCNGREIGFWLKRDGYIVRNSNASMLLHSQWLY